MYVDRQGWFTVCGRTMRSRMLGPRIQKMSWWPSTLTPRSRLSWCVRHYLYHMICHSCLCTLLLAPHCLLFLPSWCVHHFYHMICLSYHPHVYIIVCTTWFAPPTTQVCTSLLVQHCLPLLPPWCVHHFFVLTVCPSYHPDVCITAYVTLFALSTKLLCTSLFVPYCLPVLTPWCA